MHKSLPFSVHYCLTCVCGGEVRQDTVKIKETFFCSAMFCFLCCEYKKGIVVVLFLLSLSIYGTISLVDNLQLITFFVTKNTREEVGTSMPIIRSCASSNDLKIPCQVDVGLTLTSAAVSLNCLINRGSYKQLELVLCLDS